MILLRQQSPISRSSFYLLYIYCLTLCWVFREVKGSSRFQIIILLKFSIEGLQDWIVDALYCLTLQDRIVEMTLDKEYDVAVQAIKLVINILKWVDLFFSLPDKFFTSEFNMYCQKYCICILAKGRILNCKALTAFRSKSCHQCYSGANEILFIKKEKSW